MAQRLRDLRRYAIVGITVVAAVLSPPDPLSLFAWAVLGVLLYETAILALE